MGRSGAAAEHDLAEDWGRLVKRVDNMKSSFPISFSFAPGGGFAPLSFAR
jgi:hypothetical protein